MSTVLAESTRLLLPSEALKQKFDLPDGLLPGQQTPQQDEGQFTTHAVLVGNIGLLLPIDQISSQIYVSPQS